jgi:hypothetical protein
MRFELIHKLFLRQSPLPLGYRSEEWEVYRGLTQATVYLPIAPSGFEPEIFAFKERDVANYTTGQ